MQVVLPKLNKELTKIEQTEVEDLDSFDSGVSDLTIKQVKQVIRNIFSRRHRYRQTYPLLRQFKNTFYQSFKNYRVATTFCSANSRHSR